MKFKLLSLFVASLSLAGCGSMPTSTANYTPPKQEVITNTKVSAKTFDEVWDNLVRQLSSDFFVINNIDKNSRLINLSFSSNRPSDFVDCGDTTRSFKNMRGEQLYQYKTADSANYVFVDTNGLAWNVNRETKLEGRTNIYVAPENSGTLVSINTKYILGVTLRGVGFDGRPSSNSFSMDFSTKAGGSTREFSCNAIGNLESKILKMID